jgi:hypothetical protein
LFLKQKVNDGGEARFAILQIEGSITTENEQLAFLRAYISGNEVFSIDSSATINGRGAIFSDTVTAGFSTLSTDTLNLASNVYLTTDDSGIFAQRNGQNPQAFRFYNTQNTDNGDAEYLSLNWTSNLAKIGTEKKLNGTDRDLALGVGSANTIKLSSGNKIAFFGATPVVQPTLGAATAGSSYGTNERDMIQRVYNALRTLGLAS